jgi:Mce-associated membrane protein
VPLQRPHPARRRPRVAGRQHPSRPGAVALDEPPPSLGKAAGEAPADEEVAARSRWWTPVQVALVAVVLVALGTAAWLHGQTNALLESAAMSNRALLDPARTAEVSGQVRDAVERVFSYDFARLDDNERAAAAMITGPFAADYRRQFARVRQLAPGQQAVVVATVPALAVKLLDGDRAVVVVFIDQQANRGGQAQPLLAAGRLRVTAQRVTGSWKIADVQPF